MKAKFFKKIALSLILIVSLILTISFGAKAESDFPTDKILYLTASVGQTYDHVGISYHTASDDSYILYGKVHALLLHLFQTHMPSLPNYKHLQTLHLLLIYLVLNLFLHP